jgi:3-methylcrotonyl-CoA carboxylase alpha subunit
VGDDVVIGWKGVVYHLSHPDGATAASTVAVAAASGVSSPMPGTVIKVAVREGQRVAAREPLVVIEAMKMEHVIEAPHEGVVREILYREGDLVPSGAPVVRLQAA